MGIINRTLITDIFQLAQTAHCTVQESSIYLTISNNSNNSHFVFKQLIIFLILHKH